MAGLEDVVALVLEGDLNVVVMGAEVDGDEVVASQSEMAAGLRDRAVD